MNRPYFKTVKRVNKKVARRLYEAGEEVFFIPCNLRPEPNFWGIGIWEHKDLWGQYKDFDTLVSYYESYNCDNYQGRYTAFYIKQEA